MPGAEAMPADFLDPFFQKGACAHDKNSGHEIGIPLDDIL